MAGEFRMKRRVAFSETDKAGIVHFRNFFRYIEDAEHALWRSVGLSISPEGADIGWPRVRAACEFKKPLKFEDEFEVVIRVAAKSKKTITYAARIEKDGELIAEGELVIACVSIMAGAPMRAIAIPEEYNVALPVADDAESAS